MCEYFPEFSTFEPTIWGKYRVVIDSLTLLEADDFENRDRYKMWFNVTDFDSRIKVLKKCIEMCKSSKD